MEETKKIYVSDYRRLFPMQEAGPLGDLSRPSKSDRLKREEEQLVMNQNLADDHLTATYWG